MCALWVERQTPGGGCNCQWHTCVWTLVVLFGWRDNDIPVCGCWLCCLTGKTMTYLCVDDGCAAWLARQWHTCVWTMVVLLDWQDNDIPVCGRWLCCLTGKTMTYLCVLMMVVLLCFLVERQWHTCVWTMVVLICWWRDNDIPVCGRWCVDVVLFGWRDNDIPVCGRWLCCLGGEVETVEEGEGPAAAAPSIKELVTSRPLMLPARQCADSWSSSTHPINSPKPPPPHPHPPHQGVKQQQQEQTLKHGSQGSGLQPNKDLIRTWKDQCEIL